MKIWLINRLERFCLSNAMHNIISFCVFNAQPTFKGNDLGRLHLPSLSPFPPPSAFSCPFLFPFFLSIPLSFLLPHPFTFRFPNLYLPFPVPFFLSLSLTLSLPFSLSLALPLSLFSRSLFSFPFPYLLAFIPFLLFLSLPFSFHFFFFSFSLPLLFLFPFFHLSFRVNVRASNIWGDISP